MIALEWNTHTATVNCRSISYAQENGQRCLKERHKSPIIAPQSWQLEKLQHFLFIWFDLIQGLFFNIFSHRSTPMFGGWNSCDRFQFSTCPIAQRNRRPPGDG